ncbi:MAG: response regulator [Desulfomonilaceae bacterium]
MPVILHIEDESSVRLLYREVFEELGFRVLQAPNAEEALLLLRSHRPDVIILDLKMPGMGGRAFLKKFHKLKYKAPIVVSTAYPFVAEDPISQEIDAFVVKSGDMDELIKKVQELLSK